HPLERGGACLAELRALLLRLAIAVTATVAVGVTVGSARNGLTVGRCTDRLGPLRRSGWRHRSRGRRDDAWDGRTRGYRRRRRRGGRRLRRKWFLGTALDAGDHVLLREGRDVPHLLLDALAATAVGGLALLPVREHRRGDEDRGIRTGGEPDHHREGEVLQGRATEDEQHGDQEDAREAGDQRPGEHLT